MPGAGSRGCRPRSRRCAENWSPSATSGAGNCWTCPAPRGPTPAPRHRCGSCPPSTNAVLGYQDRGRIIGDPHRGLSVTGARFVLVDGRVSATWTVKDGTVTVAPRRRLTRPERAEVAAEGQALASFLSEGGSDRVTVGAAPP
ncbi:DNA glycosylase AlkZ-like family protein [Streptomyces lividans]|uniref:DNA glycosylase AlkZ-like family protein n=1 Tax=Streptomyces lividans TaxID=1916 RepID=UPI003AF27581